LLSSSFGLIGVCLAFALSATCCRGIGNVLYGCSVLRFSLWRYLAGGFVPALLASALPALLLYGLVWLKEPATWLELVVQGGVYGIAFVTSCVLFLGLPRRLGRTREGQPSSAPHREAPSPAAPAVEVA